MATMERNCQEHLNRKDDHHRNVRDEHTCCKMLDCQWGCSLMADLLPVMPVAYFACSDSLRLDT